MNTSVRLDDTTQSAVRELDLHEMEQVSGGAIEFTVLGYTFFHGGIAGGGSMTTITHNGGYVYYETCWPKN
ncbi:hypothetical protein [Oryzifoliimicrobium ureilyticus]|uniref:hypothetical protein n=1 Tax=Oryzifoliimicrobium ureilyticus TaxID=3113724 RepID=UPI00307670DF